MTDKRSKADQFADDADDFGLEHGGAFDSFARIVALHNPVNA